MPSNTPCLDRLFEEIARQRRVDKQAEFAAKVREVFGRRPLPIREIPAEQLPNLMAALDAITCRDS